MAKQVSKATRIKRLTQNINSEQLEEAKRLAESIIYLEDKLDEAREIYADENLVETYDNGGGQIGTRKSPALSAYQDVMKSYRFAMNELNSMKATKSDIDELANWFGW